MAKAQLSVLLEDLSGKAGTAVFASTKFGTLVRARPTPNQPNSNAQQSARKWLTIAAETYKTLSPENVQAWEQFGAPTQAANIAFMSLSAKFLQIQAYLGTSASLPLLPPTAPFQITPLDIQISGVSGNIQLSASANNPINTRTELLIQRLPNQNRTPKARSYKTAAFFNLRAGIPALYSASPGAYAVAIRYVKTTTGESTDLIPKGTITIP